jgi:hypothetical protein
MVGVVATVLGLAGAVSASADPVTRLLDADLVCGEVTLESSQWVALPPSGTLWIKDSALAGHYVIVSDTHYVVPGYAQGPPSTYEGLEPVDTRFYGAKVGLDTMDCHFVSRWQIPGEPVFSVVGPITIARLPGSSR